MAERFRRYAEFWPHYLAEHRRPGTRALHYLGTGLGVAFLLLATVFGSWLLAVAAILAGYGCAWLGHLFLEHNKPATFRHPVWSLFSDFRMAWLSISGELGAELERHRISPWIGSRAGKR